MKTVAKLKEFFQILDISGKIAMFKSLGSFILSNPACLPPMIQEAVIAGREELFRGGNLAVRSPSVLMKVTGT